MMSYEELLLKLQRFEIRQIAHQKIGEEEIVYVGNPEGFVIPFAPPHPIQPLHLDNGPQTEIHPEVIAALLRRFGISQEDFDAS